ncbi:MAG TPA: four helix bundle protein [Saprospiraceae bacterium]|nr:four helix bundle protein [Saprospiraceae bacterium]
MKDYTELNVWIKTRELATLCYELTKKFSKEELFGLSSQIRRSAVSIPSNIAEGCGRSTSKTTNQFLFIARGSLYELETQCLISNDLNYIDQETLNTIIDKISECKKLLNGIINYYNNKEEKTRG